VKRPSTSVGATALHRRPAGLFEVYRKADRVVYRKFDKELCSSEGRSGRTGTAAAADPALSDDRERGPRRLSLSG